MAYRPRVETHLVEDHLVDQAVGARLRHLRRLRNISQVRLAATLGVSFQQVQKYEKGANRLSASMLVRAAADLGVSVSELIGEVPHEAQGAQQLLAALETPDAKELLENYERMSNDARSCVRALAQSLASLSDTSDNPRKVGERAVVRGR